MHFNMLSSVTSITAIATAAAATAARLPNARSTRHWRLPLHNFSFPLLVFQRTNGSYGCDVTWLPMCHPRPAKPEFTLLSIMEGDFIAPIFLPVFTLFGDFNLALKR